MREGGPNNYPGKCFYCQQWVVKGAGIALRRPDDGGDFHWHAAHEHACPTAGDTPGGGSLPVWAVPCEGMTPAGHPAKGVQMVQGMTRPADDAIPVCAAAQAVVTREESQ